MLSNDRDVVPLTPGLQLLDRRGAERIAGREHDRLAFADEAPRQLADRRRFTRTIDADHENDERCRLFRHDERLCDRPQYREQLVAQPRAQGLDIAELVAGQPLLEVGDDALAGLDPHVGHHEQRLEFLERVLVDLAARRQVREIVGQPAIAAVQPRAQAFEEPAFLLRVRLLLLFPAEYHRDRCSV